MTLMRFPTTLREWRSQNEDLFLIAQMSQNSIDDVLVLDTWDDFYRPAAVAADFDKVN